MTELEDIILTIDTREQNQVRIEAVEDWFTGHGAVVEHSALKHCDYRLIGEFRGISVNLGVEAKGWDNFLSDDIAEMEEKLLLATEEYDRVGFFVVSQNYSFKPDENNKHGKLEYSLPSLNNKNLPAKTLAAFEGFLDTISKHPQIHVRQLRSEAQFPYSLYDLLVYLQKEHTVFSSTRNGTMHKSEYIAWYKHFLATIPSMTTIKRIEKLIVNYPNLFWLCSASEESLISVMGKQVGMTVYAVLHDRRFETDEWHNGYHRDGTPKDEPLNICTKCHYTTPNSICPVCGAICDKPKLKKQGDEGRLAFDAPAKNPVKYGHIDTKCAFADPKKHAICTTPNHFKHKEGYCTYNCKPLSEIPSHPSSFLKSLPTPQQLDDPQRPPINRNQNSEVKQESLSELSSPAETYIGTYREVKPNVYDPKAKKMSLEPTIKEFMKDGKPHLMQEIVDYCKGWGAPHIFDRVMANIKSGNIKKVTEQGGRITFQRIT